MLIKSALDAYHLLQRVHDVDEIRLIRHHLVDILVGARNFVHDAAILAAFDALRLFRQIETRKSLLRLRAAHAAAGAVRARAERFAAALAAHDERLRAHAARDDAELTFTRADRALARDEQFLA